MMRSFSLSALLCLFGAVLPAHGSYVRIDGSGFSVRIGTPSHHRKHFHHHSGFPAHHRFLPRTVPHFVPSVPIHPHHFSNQFPHHVHLHGPSRLPFHAPVKVVPAQVLPNQVTPSQVIVAPPGSTVIITSPGTRVIHGSDFHKPHHRFIHRGSFHIHRHF